MASSDWGWMAAVAGEELAKLEASHPGRFGPLKADLKGLIAEPGWDGAGAFALVSPSGGASSSSCSQSAPAVVLACTQESTSQKKKRKWRGGGGAEEGKRRRTSGVMDSADMAIERAKRCLKRIRAVKRSLLGFTD